ncbi:hypothetical protein BWR59_03590 [Pseudomonas sp. Bc-h]|nr:hypothetical protein BWR59_03590 [Pseudomonas sp. Bc-h]
MISQPIVAHQMKSVAKYQPFSAVTRRITTDQLVMDTEPRPSKIITGQQFCDSGSIADLLGVQITIHNGAKLSIVFAGTLIIFALWIRLGCDIADTWSSAPYQPHETLIHGVIDACILVAVKRKLSMFGHVRFVGLRWSGMIDRIGAMACVGPRD